MDKDFIKIDDLVRLRLSGVEERERSGSWLNMRELLDKEMPQEKDGGLFYWRRTFNTIAVLSLVATIGISGFELSRSLNSYAIDNNVIISDAASTTPANVATKGGEETKTYQSKETITTAVNKDHNTNESQAVDNNTKSTATTSGTASHSNHNNNKTIKNNNRPTSTTHQNKADNQLLAANVVPDKHEIANNSDSKNVTAKKPSVSDNGTSTGAETAKASAAENTHSRNVKHNNTNKTSANNNATEKTETASTAITKHKNTHTHVSRINNTAGNTAKEKGTATGVAADNHKHAHNTTNVNKMALGSAASVATDKTKATTGGTAAIAGKIADMSGLSAVKSGISGKTDIKALSAKGTGSIPANSGNTEGAVASSVKVPALPAVKPAKPAIDEAALKNLSVSNISKGKKVIERIVLHEHFIKTTPGEGYFKLDTISLETVTTELGMKGDNGSSHSSVAARKPATSSSAKDEEGNETASNEAATATNNTIVPAATANAQPAPALKAAAATQKSGSSVVEKLNNTFNDIKYKFGAPKFQPGVTAGINSTFFGPNSFKGFQFGVTGNLVFNDQWSILSELKYFQRINGNTSIEDNYNTYTPVSGGQFSKQQQLNSYSFSALHSIELPVSIRYCMGNFNFFAGGNIVYTFSINTGAETLPVTTAPVLVSAAGNDNAPKLKAEDFNSRFGLGYLMGLSYSLGSSTMLDLRSVQTVWDNAGGSGAKMISSQLYKSPSLQLSIIYRLGGNRNREQ